MDPKTILRQLKPNKDGRLPVAMAALAASLLDPVGVRSVDHLEEAMSHLDGMVADAKALLGSGEPDIDIAAAGLNHAILERSGYQGDSETYDDLRNANLFRVIERRRGLPIALGLIYMHVGRSVGLTVDGLAFPGHFILRLETPGGRSIIDPFFGGMQRDAAALRNLLKNMQGPDAELLPEHYEPVSDTSVLIRLQNNLKMRLMQKEKYAEASTVLETMLMISPKEPGLWREAGLLHVHTGNIRAALTALTNYVDMTPPGSDQREMEALMAGLRRKLN